jgi:hypothetical protein
MYWRVLGIFLLVWAVIGSYAYSWYVLDQSRHEMELLEQRMQTDADMYTRELEAKLVEKIFKEGRRSSLRLLEQERRSR